MSHSSSLAAGFLVGSLLVRSAFKCQSRTRGLDMLKNQLQYILRFLQHLVVPEAKHLKALLTEPLATLGILLSLSGMLSAVHLDHKSGFEADEVDDVGPDMTLPPKLETGHLPSPQISPQPLLCIGHVVS